MVGQLQGVVAGTFQKLKNFKNLIIYVRLFSLRTFRIANHTSAIVKPSMSRIFPIKEAAKLT